MNRPQLLAPLAAALVLGAAPAVFAQSVDLTAHPASSRVERRFSLAGVASVLGNVPLVGAAAQYQLSDRISVGGQLGLGPLMIDAGAGTRLFLDAAPTSGLFVDLSAHAIRGPLANALGGIAELGYQYRARSGFLFEASAGLAVLNIPKNKCGCGDPYSNEGPWHGKPQLSMRFGYAF